MAAMADPPHASYERTTEEHYRSDEDSHPSEVARRPSLDELDQIQSSSSRRSMLNYDYNPQDNPVDCVQYRVPDNGLFNLTEPDLYRTTAN